MTCESRSEIAGGAGKARCEGKPHPTAKGAGMARAAARAAAPPAPARRGRSRPIEEDVLLTAVLCLVAVRSGHGLQRVVGQRPCIKGGGDGTAFLVKYVMYGAIGFVAMPSSRACRCSGSCGFTGPLLAHLLRAAGARADARVRRLGQRRAALARRRAPDLPAQRDRRSSRSSSTRRQFLAERPRGFRRWQELVPLGARRGARGAARRLPAGPRDGARDRLHDRRDADRLRRADPLARRCRRGGRRRGRAAVRDERALPPRRG